MKKLFVAVSVSLALVACASAPQSASPATPVAPAAASPAPRSLVVEIALPVSIKSYYPNGDLAGSESRKYTEKGLLLSQETYNANGVLTETRTGKSSGSLWRVTVVNAQTGEITALEDTAWGANGELLSQTLLTAKEVIQASNEYQYDKQGRKTVWETKTGAGGLQSRTIYSYDSHGNNIKTELFDAGGVLTNVFESTFSEQNLILTRKGYDAAKNLVELTLFTWKDGRLVKEETQKPLLRSLDYSYAEKNAPTTIVSTVRGKVKERQVFEYQWITKTKTVNP